MSRHRNLALAATLATWLPLLALAQSSTGQRAQALRAADDKQVTELPMYLAFHPDERWLQNGMNERARARPQVAREYFQYAARYAQKAAQALYARMLWEGEGGITDHALAYAWMDLAAERGYPGLLTERDRLWAALDAAEQARALKLRPTVYAEYGDAAAKPRMERELRRGLHSRSGSHIGSSTGRVQAYRSLSDAAAGPAVTMTTLGNVPARASTTTQFGAVEQLWNKRYWQPEPYWAFQEQRWAHFAPGTVTEKPLVPVNGGGASGTPERRR